MNIDLCSAQILVKVANIQAKALRAEAEKGSMSPAVVHGLVDPKASGRTVLCLLSWGPPKGNPVNIPEPPGSLNVSKLRGNAFMYLGRRCLSGEELFFSV